MQLILTPAAVTSFWFVSKLPSSTKDPVFVAVQLAVGTLQSEVICSAAGPYTTAPARLGRSWCRLFAAQLGAALRIGLRTAVAARTDPTVRRCSIVPPKAVSY